MSATRFSQEVADEICRRMSNGESLRSVCREDRMPTTSTVREWVLKRPDFAEQYAKARNDLYEHWAEEILDISDDGTNDWMEREKESGRIETLPDHEHINRSRLRVDSRKWLLSKLLPKKFGDRQTLEHTGADGSPLQILLSDPRWLSLQKEIVAAVCPECRARLLALLGGDGV